MLYTDLVKTGVITLERLKELLCDAPRKRFKEISPENTDESFCVWALDECYEIDPGEFISKGRSTPFEGKKVFGRCILTVYNGKIVYFDKRLEK